eukprot:scaffold12244_cov1364-Chaetoceros_neogracile.AAC.1
MIQNGLISDPPGLSFYVKVLNLDGSNRVDAKGLQLYRSIRGTNLVESFYELLTRSFGHTQAGAFYSDCLLTFVRHQHNWRASLRNRPCFPQLRHYDGEAIDIVNDLYEFCIGNPKYPKWVGISPYGIVPSSTNATAPQRDHAPSNKITTSKDYIASRQQTDIPYLPVYGKEEYMLFNNLMKDAIREGTTLNSKSTFLTMADKWNEFARGDQNKIYYKSEVHLARHYKRWRKNQSKREAISHVSLKRLLEALQRSSAPLPTNRNANEDNNTVDVMQQLALDEPLPGPGGRFELERYFYFYSPSKTSCTHSCEKKTKGN